MIIPTKTKKQVRGVIKMAKKIEWYNTIDEKWLPVEGYDGYYISSRGRFGRMRGHADYAEDPLKLHEKQYDKDGYVRFSMRKNGGRKHVHAHRLVMFAFSSNPNNLPQVNHKNGVRDDNRIENLEWVTAKENINHAYDKLGRKGHNGGQNIKVDQICLDTGDILETHNSLKDASLRLGFSKTFLGVKFNESGSKEIVYDGFRWKKHD